MQLRLLWECRRGHGKGHRLWHLLGVKGGELWGVAHAILNSPLVGTKLLALITLVSIGTGLTATTEV